MGMGTKNLIKPRNGFTLIEMLVVAAILCILAAIAVPNFLEAQTRSKVARVKADLRTVAMALEHFSGEHDGFPGTDIKCGRHLRCVDHNTSKHTQCEARWTGWLSEVNILTTPIAYMSTVARADPFIRIPARTHIHLPNKNSLILPQYDFGPANPDDGEIPPTVVNSVIYLPPGDERDPPPIPTYMYAVFPHYDVDRKYLNPKGETFFYITRKEKTEIHRPRYYLVSVGPDGVSGPDAISGKPWNILAYIQGNDHTPGMENTFQAWQYDPTNGTNSAGDLIRHGDYYDQ